MVPATRSIRGINPKSKIENPQAPEFISRKSIQNRKSKIENRMTQPKNGYKFPTIAVEGKKF